MCSSLGASCLYFEIEITRKRVNSQVLSPEDALRQQSWQKQRGARPCFGVKDQQVVYLPSLEQGKHCAYTERLLEGQKEGVTTPG